MPGLISERPNKKRKAHGDPEPKATKKAANDAAASTIKISWLQDEELCPVVASSPGLSLPPNIPLNAFKKPNGSGPYELLLQSSRHARLDYEAHQSHDGPDSHLQHYVGVYDPATGELRLTEARHLTMRTALRPEASSDDEQEDVRKTNAAKRFELTTAFGTKKARKAVSSLSTNAIVPGKEDEAAEAALLDSVAATSGDAPTREALQSVVDDAKPRPHANIEAADVRNVYPLTSLISAEELHMVPVQEWIEMTKEKAAVNVHSRYVARRLRHAAELAISSGDAPHEGSIAHEKIIALRYLYTLTELYAAGKTTRGGGKRLPKRDVLQKKLEIDNRLLGSVMRRFGAEGELTKWKLDYLITHACALALIVDDFHVDTNDIREDLALKDKDMLQYFRELGCIITAPTEADLAKAKVGRDGALQHRIAKLRLPLQFPRQRVIVQRKR